MECGVGARLSAGPGSGLNDQPDNQGEGGAGRRFDAGLPPLGLYVHLPWCVRKCPYCDFNSHAAGDEIPEHAYVDALLADLDGDLEQIGCGRKVQTLFIGGGTPSLFSGEAIARLLQGIRNRVDLAGDTEITLEANPGTVDSARFAAYRDAGVNRLSIGVQSLSADHLQRLGRIHDPGQASAAVGTAREAGFENLNLDMMYALPAQSLSQAEDDLRRLIDLRPAHISYYQLTLEPNTAFAHAPPPLPDDDLAADIHEQGIALLQSAGYGHYEVSGHAGAGRRCRHNLNYWTFGDYLGIGAGAHGKLTDPVTGEVRRVAKQRQPRRYLHSAGSDTRVGSSRSLSDADLILEFALNALRLLDGVPTSLFTERTGLPAHRIAPALGAARDAGLLEPGEERLQASALGQRFLNDLLHHFDVEGQGS